MKVGITTPIVTQLPGAHGRWERTAGVDDLARVVEHAEALHFDYVTCSEHVAVPDEIAADRGGVYWDPLATFGYLAARTATIRLVTSVLVLGYHHPLAIAKRYGTLDRVSGGRLVLGVGVGSLREEFDLLGSPFEGRGEQADDAMRALRASLGDPRPRYHGTHFDFEGVVVEPCALQPHVPLWVGGRSRRSLRRAAELGDGWMPFGLELDEIGRMLADADRPAGFEAVISPPRAFDPGGHPDRAVEVLAELADRGATIVNARIVGQSVGHYLDQLTGLAELARLADRS